MPETPENWVLSSDKERFELKTASNELLAALADDAAEEKPRLAAEAQAKYDCWISSLASQQYATAEECRKRFENAMLAIKGNGGIIDGEKTADAAPAAPGHGFPDADAAVDTSEFGILTDTKRTRDGVVVVNNINIPSNLVRAPTPVVFNQNFYGGESGDKTLGNETVSRDEFINMMMSLRNEIQAINGRIDAMPRDAGVGTATIKVGQIPTTPKERIMEEIFEVKFDFNKSAIKPEFESVIKDLAAMTREHRNVKISVVGHTDTVGTNDYNYALGGRRAESVKKMLVSHGVPAGSIIVVSSGKNDLKVPTGANVKNADNRRVRVVKEVRYTEQQKAGLTKPEPVAE
jgi:outer membrane protein OmpA-like peptidoglycan-associated protein